MHSSLFPDKAYFRELRRPWKLASFGLGMAWLFYGAVAYGVSDWDIGVSIIMGSITYIFAPWSVYQLHLIIRVRPRNFIPHLIAALLPAFLAVDWSYWLYHTIAGNRMLRWENFKTSMALYFICGMIWYYRGSLQKMRDDLLSLNRTT